ncbi:hypothetical protein Hamer_G019835 [Homarus americanus]|uniref:Uncharacterized protein n=1 Tax=Homarus americanus TaxID=6706 RepID=A0A8J5JRI4_HOMAM|nr:hypothetical protein Hamer_G019835 [Homarus americanus]
MGTILPKPPPPHHHHHHYHHRRYRHRYRETRDSHSFELACTHAAVWFPSAPSGTSDSISASGRRYYSVVVKEIRLAVNHHDKLSPFMTKFYT